MYSFGDSYRVKQTVKPVNTSTRREKFAVAHSIRMMELAKAGERWAERRPWLIPFAMIGGGLLFLIIGVLGVAILPLKLLAWLLFRRSVRNAFLMVIVFGIVILESGVHCFVLGWGSDVCR